MLIIIIIWLIKSSGGFTYKQKTSGCKEKEPSSIAFVLPIWRVYPKKLTGECDWNYIK